MKITILIILLFIRLTSFAQINNEQLCKTFIEKTIQYYYSHQKEQKISKLDIFILKDSLTKNINTFYTGFKIFIVTREEAVEKISKSNKKIGQLNKVDLMWFGQDTCDIDIAGWGISVKKRNLTFSAGCGGDLGHIPICRFIYDKSTNIWKQIYDKEIIQEKLKKIELTN